MTRLSLLAALLAASTVTFAQTTTTAPGSSLGSSGSTLGAPGSAIGGNPATPGVTTGSPTIPSTGTFNRPGDTTLPGTRTTPGLSTLPGATDDRDSASVGSSRAPFGMQPSAPRAPGIGSNPNCIPGSLVNPC